MLKSNWFCTITRHDWLRKLTPLFRPIRSKPKLILTLLHTFSRASRQLHVFTSSFDWFIGLSASFVIGWSDYFWFYVTQLKTALILACCVLFSIYAIGDCIHGPMLAHKAEDEGLSSVIYQIYVDKRIPTNNYLIKELV